MIVRGSNSVFLTASGSDRRRAGTEMVPFQKREFSFLERHKIGKLYFSVLQFSAGESWRGCGWLFRIRTETSLLLCNLTNTKITPRCICVFWFCGNFTRQSPDGALITPKAQLDEAEGSGATCSTGVCGPDGHTGAPRTGLLRRNEPGGFHSRIKG